MSNKVLILCLSDEMGGAEQVLKQIAVYYVRLDYEVDVYFLTAPKGNLWNDIKNEVNLYYTKFQRNKVALPYYIMKLISNTNIYEYCFSSHILLNSLAGFLSRLGFLKCDYIIARDSHLYLKVNKGFRLLYYKMLIKIGYSGLSLLITQTEQMCQSMSSYMSNLIRVEHISNPIGLIKLSEVTEIDFNVVNKKFILAVGRLIPIKGFDLLIRSFKSLDIKDNYQLVILGEGNDRERLTKLIIKEGMTDSVLLLGFKDNVMSYMKAATCCVVSSINEGFPNVLLQMMSVNNRVVSTLCADGIDKIAGIITCSTNSVQDLSKALISALNLSVDDDNHTRLMFDIELKSRSIDRFIDRINKALI